MNSVFTEEQSMFKRIGVITCGLALVLMSPGAASAQGTTTKAKAKTESTAKKTGTYMSDAEITTAVKTKFLADSKVSGLNIGVETNNGVVTLTGPVSSAAERARARRLAIQTKGVKRVVSKLKIEKKK
jgi:hyperosmotically inducible protein